MALVHRSVQVRVAPLMSSLPSVGWLCLAFAAAALISIAADRAGALSRSGAIAAFIVGFALFAFAGWPGAVALLLFFVTSSALSRVGKRRKDALGFEKSGTRDAGQVLANGGVAAFCALCFLFLPQSPLIAAALLGAIATANADTYATEMGAYFAHPPRLITTFRLAPVGASGAVSLPGTLWAFIGASVIAPVAFWFGIGPLGALTVLASGFAGALFDSLLGATIQVQYRCPTCGKLTERHTHCDGIPTEWARGFRFVNNDAVNFTATASGALLSAVLYSTFR